ncbi:MAG: PEP-CTERM sorting domain-containing protein [Phycisphaera sp.]|nr:MAG: PEP-CTERM sorting domain-containing protein [Phycisphaera sp.]
MRKIAILAVAMTAGVASGQNLLNNAGFEDDLGFDFSNVTNWNGFFGGPAGTLLEAFNDTGTAPRSGARALELTIQGDPNFPTDGFGAFTGHVQQIPGISEGAEYNLSIWARSNGNVTNAAELRIEWFDAADNNIGSTGNLEMQDFLTSEYQQFSIGGVAPAGATRANAVVAVQSFLNDGIIADISIAVDDAEFVLVPAPASAALLGLGGLVAARRRR